MTELIGFADKKYYERAGGGEYYLLLGELIDSCPRIKGKTEQGRMRTCLHCPNYKDCWGYWLAKICTYTPITHDLYKIHKQKLEEIIGRNNGS